MHLAARGIARGVLAGECLKWPRTRFLPLGNIFEYRTSKT
jgi:hypothetical protein